MRDLLEKLCGDARVALTAWKYDNEAVQEHYMAELENTLKEVGRMMPQMQTYECGPACYWRDKNSNGDKCKFYLVAMMEEKTKKLSFGLKIITLTATPEQYIYDKILRKGENYYLIEYKVTMRYEAWLNVANGIKEIWKHMPEWEEYKNYGKH